MTDQYRIITEGAGWFDRSRCGRLKFEGADVRAFLQGLLTNDVAALEPGRGLYAGYLTPQGRMLADLVLIDRGDHVLGLAGEGLGASLAERFDQLIFTEDVRVVDVTEQTGEIVVTGGTAVPTAAEAAGVDAVALDGLPELGWVAGAAAVVMRDGVSPLPAFRLVFDAPVRDQIRGALVRRGAIELDSGLVTALRIEAGRAEWGRELGDDVIPLEAGLLERAISTSKGCYVGQEIVIRILHRGGGRVAKRLVTLVFDADTPEAPPVDARLEAEGTAGAAGRLTSVAFSPIRNAFVALAYLQREAAEIGRRVTVAGTGASAVVTGFAQ